MTGRATRILYGGSVKPDNAKELMGQEDVDGLADPGRAAVAARLHPGVVGIESAPGRQTERVLGVDGFGRGLVDDDAERSRPPEFGGIARPEPAVQERGFERVERRARPLDPAELLEP